VTARRAALLAGGTMLLVYLATLAPSVTFWDAGEFIAAARVLGIPHPPGTPLFIILLSAWARVLSFMPFALATNAFSGVCTAAAVALVAWWLARAVHAPVVAMAAAITAGAMSSIWLNATETEVYAASLWLSVCAIVAGDVAGRTGQRRWRVLATYLMALSLPLHLSAVVAAPVVIYLAARGTDESFDWYAATELSGVTLFVVAISRTSPLLAVAATVLIAVANARQSLLPKERILHAARTIGVSAIACSLLAFLLIRARHDPAINQGNPATIRELSYVIARRQYDVASLLPRQAPVWLQLANWFEYADWQTGLGLGPTVVPTVARVTVSLVFALLAVAGARWHRRADPRTWVAVLMLFVCGSLGVIAYVNLKAGASFAWMLVPDASHHEARDRDYFFVLGFLAWGLWAGMGAMSVAARFKLPVIVGVAVAALPIALNWRAVTRRSEPDASMPAEVAKALLTSVPAKAVLFVSGDNDSYPLWFAQQVNGLRNDVTVVTMPLLTARWYVAELERRHRLIGGSIDGAAINVARRIADRARAMGRPVAVALTVPKGERGALGNAWVSVGVVALEYASSDALTGNLDSSETEIPIALKPTEAARDSIERWRAGRAIHPSIDPVHEYFGDILSCPRLALEKPPNSIQLGKLDSLCNLR
jgi:hypothetical protein